MTAKEKVVFKNADLQAHLKGMPLSVGFLCVISPMLFGPVWWRFSILWLAGGSLAFLFLCLPLLFKRFRAGIVLDDERAAIGSIDYRKITAVEIKEDMYCALVTLILDVHLETPPQGSLKSLFTRHLFGERVGSKARLTPITKADIPRLEMELAKRLPIDIRVKKYWHTRFKIIYIILAAVALFLWYLNLRLLENPKVRMVPQPLIEISQHEAMSEYKMGAFTLSVPSRYRLSESLPMERVFIDAARSSSIALKGQVAQLLPPADDRERNERFMIGDVHGFEFARDSLHARIGLAFLLFKRSELKQTDRIHEFTKPNLNGFICEQPSTGGILYRAMVWTADRMIDLEINGIGLDLETVSAIVQSIRG